MKKFLPFILLGGGVIVFIVVFMFIKKSFQPAAEPTPTDEPVVELKTEESPVTSLTPSADGHWLKLKVEGIKLSAKSMDYELLYTLPDGRTQGVPGTIDLKGQDAIQRDLLLGSESSGKFRYDQGVKGGTLTLKFRDNSGKLTGKLTTNFTLSSNTTNLASSDSSFKFTLASDNGKTFYIAMKTFGLPDKAPGVLASGPYGIFPSDTISHKGTVTLSGSKPYEWNGGSWQSIDTSSSVETGIFIGTN
ncbi:MAG: hypothetical protein HY044_03185 [Candidatus Woesebacteria bacterium]|nr:MAG: hypothetical protein HY044_03185 [Candidatus Woesebacteria bacterium]